MAMQAHAYAGAAREVEGRSLSQDALLRLAATRRRSCRSSCCCDRALCLLRALAQPAPYDEVDWDSIRTPPNDENGHWFGTDKNGRDLFARISRAPTCRWSSPSPRPW